MQTDDYLAPWLPDSADELRFRLIMLLAPIYMTTSTATDPIVVQADATKDVARLKAAVETIMTICPPIPSSAP